MKKHVLIALAALALVLAGCGKAQTAWITDFEEAKALSEKNGKDLLVVFTGSDWDIPSQELAAAVFTEDFFPKASSKYVLCNIDVIQDSTKTTPEAQDKVYEVIASYGVQTMPYFVLQTSTGDLYASGTPPAEAVPAVEPEGKETPAATTDIKSFLNYLASFKESRTKLVNLKKAIDKSSGVEKAKNIDAFVELLSPYQRDKYADLIKEVPTLDAANEAGLLGKYSLQTAYLDAVTAYQAGNLTEAAESFKKLIDTGILDAAQTQEAWYMTSYLYAMSGTVKNEQIIEWLETAIAADPANPGAMQIQATIEQIKSNPNPAQ